jgi:hypothetical protein
MLQAADKLIHHTAYALTFDDLKKTRVRSGLVKLLDGEGERERQGKKTKNITRKTSKNCKKIK